MHDQRTSQEVPSATTDDPSDFPANVSPLRVAIDSFDSFVFPGHAEELCIRLSSEAHNSAARLAEIGNAVIDELTGLTENNDFHPRPADPLLDRELDPRIPIPEDVVHVALDTFPDAIALMTFFDGSIVVYDDPVNPLDMLHFLWPRLSRILAVHMAGYSGGFVEAFSFEKTKTTASALPSHSRSNDYRLAPELHILVSLSKTAAMLVGILQQHASNLRPRGAFLRRFAAPSHQPGDHVVTRYLAPVDDEHCYGGTAASRYQSSSLEALPEGAEAPDETTHFRYSGWV